MTLKHLLRHACPIAILDIGAADEGIPRYATLLDAATIAGFEPMDTSGKWNRACLGDGGRHSFHVTHHRPCSSLYEPDPSVVDAFNALGTLAGQNFHVVDTVQVETSRLDDFGLSADLIKADTQGSELEIFKHGCATLASAAVVEIEVGFVPLYRGQPLAADVIAFMQSQGLMLHKLIDWQSRSLRPMFDQSEPLRGLSQLVSADAVFVGPYFDLDGWSDDKLAKTAMIANDVYASTDLAHRLLLELDRRNHTDYAQQHMQDLLQSGSPRVLMNERLG